MMLLGFVSSRSKDNDRSLNDSNKEEESNEPDYDDEEIDQLEEEEAREIMTSSTTNQIF